MEEAILLKISTDSLNITFVIQQVKGQSNFCCWGRAIINFFRMFANRSEHGSDFELWPSPKIWGASDGVSTTANGPSNSGIL